MDPEEDTLTNEDVNRNYYGPRDRSFVEQEAIKYGTGGSTTQFMPLDYYREKVQIDEQAADRQRYNANQERIERGGGLAERAGYYPGAIPGETVREARDREAAASNKWWSTIREDSARNLAVSNAAGRGSAGGSTRGTAVPGSERGTGGVTNPRAYYDQMLKLQKQYQALAPTAPVVPALTSKDINANIHRGSLNDLRRTTMAMMPSLYNKPVGVRKTLSSNMMGQYAGASSSLWQKAIQDATAKTIAANDVKYANSMQEYNRKMYDLQTRQALMAQAAGQGINDYSLA